MFSQIRISALLVLVIVFLGFPLSSQAISTSAYRTYLDSDKPTTTFSVQNSNIEGQDCTLKLTHYNYDENSELSRVPEGEIPENSASKWVRFSLRKKANAKAAECRSYLIVDCEAVSALDGKKGLIAIKPKLLHHVPVIARNGKLEAEISIADINVEGYTLSFSVERSGKRSAYGDTELLHKVSDEVISSHKPFSNYAESQRHFFTLGTQGHAAEDLKIRVSEDVHFGGSLVYESDVGAE